MFYVTVSNFVVNVNYFYCIWRDWYMQVALIYPHLILQYCIHVYLFCRSKDDYTGFLHGDENLPIYGTQSSGCTYAEAVWILLNADKSRICSKQPILVQQNYIFVVNLKLLEDPDDIKSDDCGHWVHNGRKSTRVAVWLKSGEVVCVKSTNTSVPPDENSKVYTLVRTYYSQDPNQDFKRTFYHLSVSCNTSCLLVHASIWDRHDQFHSKSCTLTSL